MSEARWRVHTAASYLGPSVYPLGTAHVAARVDQHVLSPGDGDGDPGGGVPLQPRRVYRAVRGSPAAATHGVPGPTLPVRPDRAPAAGCGSGLWTWHLHQPLGGA